MDPLQFNLLETKEKIQSRENKLLGIGQTMDSDSYMKLFTLVLYQHELCTARALWERIPQHYKDTIPEFGRLWLICTGMCRKDHPSVFSAIDGFKWNEELRPFIKYLYDEIRHRSLQLYELGGYSVIDLNRFSRNMNFSREEAIAFVEQKGWKRSGENIYPCHTEDDGNDPSYKWVSEIAPSVCPN